MSKAKIEVLLSKKRRNRFETAEYSKGPIGGTAQREADFLESFRLFSLTDFANQIVAVLAKNGILQDLIDQGKLTMEEIQPIDVMFYDSDELEEEKILFRLSNAAGEPVLDHGFILNDSGIQSDIMKGKFTWKRNSGRASNR